MRDLISTVLDLVGLLLLVVAGALWTAQWSTPGALAVAGAGVLRVSWIVDKGAAWTARGARR